VCVVCVCGSYAIDNVTGHLYLILSWFKSIFEVGSYGPNVTKFSRFLQEGVN